MGEVQLILKKKTKKTGGCNFSGRLEEIADFSDFLTHGQNNFLKK